MSTREFDLNDEVPEFSRTKTYKPSPQITAVFGPDRISFVYWPDLMDPSFGSNHMIGKNPRFVGGRRIFLKGVGYVSPRFSSDHAKKTAEENELLAMYIADDPTQDPSKAIQNKAATLVIVWPKQGTNKPPEVLPWILPPTTFDEIRTKNQRQSLAQNDLEVTAKAKGPFTELKLEVAPGNTLLELLKKKEQGDPTATAHVNAILAKARELIPVLSTEIGKDLSVSEIKQRRGMERAGAAAPAGETAAVSSDVAGLVAGILAD